MKDVILASGSPRRKELLKLLFEDFEIIVSKKDETLPKNISAEKIPEYLSFIKGEDIAKENPESLVISADTIVLLNGEILGKPKDKADAFNMLNSLSGNFHFVITGCSLFYKGEHKSFSVTTKVKFYELEEIEITEYINSAEPYDKAGGYGIQSKGGLFVEFIEGDYNNVVGFPIAELKREISNFAPVFLK
ncbi:MAG: septum formation protein Maf [Clostridia bacterium]|nr:septum formation protein Maf [Clostridia bacterium]